MPGVHLHTHSAFSFLDGASHPKTLVEAAVRNGIDTVALTDFHRISGMVPFLTAAEQMGIKALIGAEVQVEDLGTLVLLVPETSAYKDFTELLSESLLTSPRGAPRVSFAMLERWARSLVALTGDRRGVIAQSWLKGHRERVPEILEKLKRIFSSDHLYLEVTANYLPGDRLLFQALTEYGGQFQIPLAASAAVHYAQKQEFGLFDLMTCIRTGQQIEETAPFRYLNSENYLKSWDEMTDALKGWPEALDNTLKLGERLSTPDILHRRYAPLFDVPKGSSADRYLTELVRKGARWRYGDQMSRVWPRVRRELSVIHQLGFSDYFLVVWDVARYARQRKIRFAGRGSAADSVVAYCLGITEVDAFSRNLLFERFMSLERREMPDIDIDFDARKRDQVEQYVLDRYGADHVARVATYQTFRQKLAVREVGKVMGFPPEELDMLAKSLPEASIQDILSRWQDIPELRQHAHPERLKRVLSWAASIEGLPRHMGTHLGGVVISQKALSEVSPREWSRKGVRIIQFDKRDVETLGLLKLDLLSLRTFTAIDLAVDAIEHRKPSFSYDHLPLTDDRTFSRIQCGEAVGVFQLESPAQRALAQRLKPDCWEDIVASLALIRPGPIKGNMVDPFIARRRGEEPITYLHPALEPILSKTYGVVLFQEQVIAIASALAGFSPGEADALRRVMTHGRSSAEMARLGQEFQDKAIARGVSEDVAKAVFNQIVGYASYGFNEAHAAAFAETAYRTAYLLEHHPLEYFLGLLNAGPLGYYPVDVLLVEARRRGIAIRPVSINRSRAMVWAEDGKSLRIGFQLVKGIGEEGAQAIEANRPASGYGHPWDVLEKTPISRDQLGTLIAIGAFDEWSFDRRGLWEDIQGNNGLRLTNRSVGPRPTVKEQIIQDYRYLGFGQHGHWLTPWRPQLFQEGFQTIDQIKRCSPGQGVKTVGTLFRPHRPPTRSGKLVVFFSLLDETGLLEARLSTKGYQKYGHLLFGKVEPVVAVSGRRDAQGVEVLAVSPWPRRA